MRLHRLDSLLLIVCVALACAGQQASGCSVGQAVGGVFSAMQYSYMAYRAVEAKPGWKGCYKDDLVNHDFPIFGGRSTYLTILGCNAMCKQKKTKFFGLQNMDCWCGNKFGKYGKADDDDCKIQCPGKPSETCGGYKLNAVYVVV